MKQKVNETECNRNGLKVKKRDSGCSVATVNDEPSLADPSFQDQCDVNNIVKRFLRTGELGHTASRQGRFIDVSNTPSMFDGMNQIHRAEEAFHRLPKEIKDRFKGPKDMIQFMQNPENMDECIELGLMVPREVKASDNVVSEEQEKGDKDAEDKGSD